MFPLMAATMNTIHTNIEWLYFILYFSIHFIVLVSIYLLTHTITGSRFSGYLAALILSLPKFVAGTNNPTMDLAFIPRFFILPLVLLAIRYIYLSRYQVAALLIGLTFTIHPYSGIYVGALLMGNLIASGKMLKLLPRVMMAGLLTSGWFLFMVIPQYGHRNQQLIMNDKWFTTVSSRLAYNNIGAWQLSAWISLAIPFLGIALTRSRFLLVSLITALAVTAIHIIFGELIHVAIIYQLQLPRVWLIPTFLGYIVWADHIRRQWLIKSIFNKSLAFVALVVLLINFGKFSSHPIDWPHQPRREWDQLQVWVEQHTPKNALFITPPTRVGFRIRSHRAIVGEIKDGSSGLYSPEFARNWSERVSDLQFLNYKTTAEIHALQKKYSADYLVTFTNAIYPEFTQVFSTPTFIVYKL